MLNKEVKVSDKLTYGEWIERIQRLEKVKDLTGEKILYARSKNLMKLRRFSKANNMESRIPVTAEFKKFQGEINTLRGKFVTIGPQGANVDVTNPDYIEALNALQAKYKDVIEERDRDYQAYTDFLGEAVPDGEIPEIHHAENDGSKELTQEQVDAIWWFVGEKVEKTEA